jgi:hypothetical protein
VPKLLDHARGGTIDLDEIAMPEILNPRQVKGLHSGISSLNVLDVLAGFVNGDRVGGHFLATSALFRRRIAVPGSSRLDRGERPRYPRSIPSTKAPRGPSDD